MDTPKESVVKEKSLLLQKGSGSMLAAGVTQPTGLGVKKKNA